MSSDPIRYWHRAKKTVETEKIYGERWLRLVYENPFGTAGPLARGEAGVFLVVLRLADEPSL